MSVRKLYRKLLQNQQNIRFGDFERVVLAFGFILERTSGSHRIYDHPRIERSLNLQNDSGEAKPYQIRHSFSDMSRCMI